MNIDEINEILCDYGIRYITNVQVTHINKDLVTNIIHDPRIFMDMTLYSLM